MADRPLAPRRRLHGPSLGVATLLALTAAGAGLLLGPADIAPQQVASILAERFPGVDLPHTAATRADEAIVAGLRLPRVALGLLVGGTLSVAGAAYQGTFRNRLADPFLLGVAGGAGLGATIALVSGVPVTSVVLPLAAFSGAALAVTATYALGQSVGGGTGAGTVMLAGVAVAAFASAVQTFLQQANTESLQRVYVWILGRLSTAGWAEVTLAAPWALVAVAVILKHARTLDVLAVGDAEAASLGVRPRRVRLILVAAATLGTAAAVAVSGLIGFVGLVVPHAVRLLCGGSYRVIVPLSLVGGGAFLVAADIVARTVVSPDELPIGVITAFVGAPFFAVVLRTTRQAPAL